jgi:hypothetical protein
MWVYIGLLSFCDAASWVSPGALCRIGMAFMRSLPTRNTWLLLPQPSALGLGSQALQHEEWLA